MATLIKLKKGYDLKLQGGIVSDEVTPASKSALYAVIPDDFTGIVPRMEVKEGDNVAAGDVLYLSLIHISEPTRQAALSRMPSSA